MTGTPLRSARAAAAAALLALLATTGCAGSQKRPETAPATTSGSRPPVAERPQAGRPAAVDEDRYQPSAFMRVVELTARQERHLVYGRPDPLPANAKNRDIVRLTVPHLEADHTSRLLIEYDRAAMDSLEDVQIMIEARIKGRDASRNIEVKNYSVVGKPSTAASVGYIGNSLITGLRAQLRDSWTNGTRVRLNRIVVDANVAQKAKVAEALERVRSREIALGARIQDSVNAEEALRAASAPPGDVGDSARAVSSADVVAAAASLTRAKEAMKAPRAELRQARDTLEALQKGTDAALVGKARELALILLADEATRDIFIQLADTSSDRLIELIAASTNRPPFVVSNQFRRIAPAYVELSGLVKNAATSGSDILQLEQDIEARIGAVIGILNYVPTQPGRLRRALAAPLRNTAIAIEDEGAQIGEHLIITLISEHARKDRRTEEVNVEIGELGVARRIADSFLFVRRPWISPELETQRVRERQQEFRDRHGVERALLSTEVEVPVGENFSAAPGVTFGWVYIPRDDGGAWARALRALKLGWGVNASFPSFSTKKVRIAPPAEGDTITPVKLDGVTVDRQTLGLSVGAIIGVFDYALSASYGRALTVPDKRDYWAVGLSFIGLAKQGRELYDKFRQP